MEFDFVGDQNFQLILKRDFKEVQKCIEVGANKAAIILSGSILETILSDYFSENLPDGKTKPDILQLSLHLLLEQAVACNLISKSDNSLATVLKTYRNLIHPGREIRSIETVDNNTSKLSFSILELLLNRIEKKYKEQFPHTADDILDKLDEDWSFTSVYEIIITKSSSSEKNKLFCELIEIDIELTEQFKSFEHVIEEDTPVEPVYPNIEWPKDLSNQLIPLLSNDFLIEQLTKLRDSVTKGESIESIARYNLLHEHLEKLENDDQEFIAIYMLSTFENLLEDSRNLVNNVTYSTIGKYIHSTNGIKAIKKLVEFSLPNFCGANINFEFDVLEQILNSLSMDNKEIALKQMNNILIKENHFHNYEDFANEAIKRKLIQFD